LDCRTTTKRNIKIQKNILEAIYAKLWYIWVKNILEAIYAKLWYIWVKNKLEGNMEIEHDIIITAEV
jgi:hypothetical protein